jgi:hypothetical protein
MKKNEYERLLVRMFIVEDLGEHLYEALSSKCGNTNLKSTYQALARNERRTRDCVEKELASIDRPAPTLRTRYIANAARPVFNAIPRKWLHRFLTRLLMRRMYSNWHKEGHDGNVDFWKQLLEHENLQHDLLGLSEK